MLEKNPEQRIKLSEIKVSSSEDSTPSAYLIIILFLLIKDESKSPMAMGHLSSSQVNPYPK